MTGVVFVPAGTEVIKQQTKTGWYFKFKSVSKHPRHDKRVPNKVSLFVPNDKKIAAEKIIRPGVMIQIRFAELDGFQTSPDKPVLATVSTHWNQIEILNRVPGKEKQ